MMNALISGQAGMAFLSEGTDIQLVTIDDVEQSRSCSPGSVSHLLNQATDVVELHDTSRDSALKTLNQLWSFDRCLGAFYIALDKCIESTENSADQLAADELFMEALAVLNELASDDATMTSAINTLSGYPFPNPGALETAEKLAAEYPKALQLISEVKRLQPAIARLFHCWTQLSEALFSGDKSRDDFRLALIGGGISGGIWRRLAVAIEDYGKIQLLRLEAAETLGGFPNNIQVLNNGLPNSLLNASQRPLRLYWKKRAKGNGRIPARTESHPEGIIIPQRNMSTPWSRWKSSAN